MQSSAEREAILESAVAGIPKVARAIAEIPAERQGRAYEAAERSYLETLQDLGYDEPVAHKLVSAVMSRLRAESAGEKLQDPQAIEGIVQDLTFAEHQDHTEPSVSEDIPLDTHSD